MADQDSVTRTRHGREQSGVGSAGSDQWAMTIDFLFHAPDLVLGDHAVRSSDTLEISDHLPVVATYELP